MIRRSLLRPTLVVACMLTLSCAGRIPWYDENPRLEVKVWGGFAEDPAPASEPLRVEVLVDTSAAMQAPMPAGPSRAQVARTSAVRFVFDLPGDAIVRVSGVGSAGHCEPPRPIGRSESGTSRVALAASVAELESTGVGSVAQALAFLADSLRTRLESIRVVAFTDLSEPCGADLCAAIAALEEAGASLDLVVIGDAPIPACVAATGRAQGPGDLPPTVGDRHPTFRALRADGGGVVVEGVVGDPPVEVVPDPVFVIVDLDPPLRIGPIRLTPDALNRLEILEFPHRDPPKREWRWEAHLELGNPETP